MSLLVSLTLATASPVASAQSARDRLDALEARTMQLEAVLQGQALGELSSRVDELSAQLRALRGELETQAQEQAALRKQLGELAAELDRRLAAPTSAAPVAAVPVEPATPVANPVAAGPVAAAPVDGAAAPARSAPAPATPEGPDTLGAVQRYQLAFEALRAADHPKAIAGFEDMIARYPDHALATNARYWLGRSLLLQNEPARAVDAFSGALASGTLDAGRVPDALLKKAQAELQLGRRDAAQATLGELIARYPDGEPARQARALLTP
jgi:tol-pal system protein YbgF